MQPAENFLQRSILRMASSEKGGKSSTSGNLLFEPCKSRSAHLTVLCKTHLGPEQVCRGLSSLGSCILGSFLRKKEVVERCH